MSWDFKGLPEKEIKINFRRLGILIYLTVKASRALGDRAELERLAAIWELLGDDNFYLENVSQDYFWYTPNLLKYLKKMEE